MQSQFRNTSLLWAYNILNPLVGTAKAEIWRLGIIITVIVYNNNNNDSYNSYNNNNGNNSNKHNNINTRNTSKTTKQ